MTSRDLIGILIFLGYYLGFAGLIALFSRLMPGPHELMRKSYHVMCSLSIFILLFLFDHWYAAVAAVVVAFTLGFLAIVLTRGVPALRSIRIERQEGDRELAHQALYVLVTFVVLLTLFWGILGPGYKYHAAVGVVAWGFGDASAAVFGKRFGKHKVKSKGFDAGKSVEGACAMALASFAAIFVTVSFLAPTTLAVNLVVSALLASAASVIELLCRKGLDNVVIPLGIALLSAPLFLAFSLLAGRLA